MKLWISGVLLSSLVTLGCGRGANNAELEPTDAAGFHLRGVKRLAENKLDEAAVDLKKAVSLEPTEPIYHNDFAVALIDLKKFSEATVSLDEAIRLNPKYINAIANRSQVLSRSGKYAAALMDANTLIDFDREFAPGYHLRGCAEYLAGNLLLAESDFTRCIKLDPAFLNALHNRALVRINLAKESKGPTSP